MNAVYIASTVAFIGWTVHKSAELLPVLQEHLEDNGGEILPHVALYEIRQWVEEQINQGTEPLAVAAIISSMRDGTESRDLHVRELVQTSFIEDLSPQARRSSAIRPLFSAPPQ